MTEFQVVDLLRWLKGLFPLMTDQQEEFIQHDLLPMDFASARAACERYVRRPNPNPRFEAFDKIRLAELLGELRNASPSSRRFVGPAYNPDGQKLVAAAIRQGLERHYASQSFQASAQNQVDAVRRCIELSSRALAEREAKHDATGRGESPSTGKEATGAFSAPHPV